MQLKPYSFVSFIEAIFHFLIIPFFLSINFYCFASLSIFIIFPISTSPSQFIKYFYCFVFPFHLPVWLSTTLFSCFLLLFMIGLASSSHNILLYYFVNLLLLITPLLLPFNVFQSIYTACVIIYYSLQKLTYLQMYVQLYTNLAFYKLCIYTYHTPIFYHHPKKLGQYIAIMHITSQKKKLTRLNSNSTLIQFKAVHHISH